MAGTVGRRVIGQGVILDDFCESSPPDPLRAVAGHRGHPVPA
jgi:hypothetical protein